MPKSYGGPAFPLSDHPGMTLRDYFAAAALPQCIALLMVNPPSEGDLRAVASRWAYEMADAMIVERAKD